MAEQEAARKELLQTLEDDIPCDLPEETLRANLKMMEKLHDDATKLLALYDIAEGRRRNDRP